MHAQTSLPVVPFTIVYYYTTITSWQPRFASLIILSTSSSLAAAAAAATAHLGIITYLGSRDISISGFYIFRVKKCVDYDGIK